MTSRLILCAVLLAASSTAAAQTPRAAVRGFIEDQTHGRLPGADVKVTREETNEVRRTTTDEAGRFAFPELPAGFYIIEATLAGFTTYRQRAHVAVGRDLWIEVMLVVTTRETITGGAEAHVPIVDKQSATLSTLVEQHLVSNLPLDGRNFLELALLAPGTATAPQGSASSVRGEFAFNTNGAREDFNNYILDGVYNVDPKLNTPAVRPPVDAIEQFEVATSSYDASFGRNAGGQVNVLTKSGTNRFAGTAYEFFRNGALDARNHFAPSDQPEPDYSRNQFGGSIGGPIARDRTFFFADYERTRLREGITRVTNVPTAAERAGDFSQSLFARPVDPQSRQPLPGGVLPPFFINPVGAAIANLYPLPNRSVAGANFVSSPTLRDDVDHFDTKIEQVIGSAMRLSGRYSISDRRLLEPFAGPAFSVVPGFGNDVARRGQNLSVSFTRATAALFNDLRFGYSRTSIGVFPENQNITNESIGLPALATNPRDAGLSLISIAGYSPLGHEYNNPQEGTTDTFQIADTVTWHRGAHLFKFGGEWVGTHQAAFRDVQARGFLTFLSQGYTGNALADVLLGLPVLTGGARLDNPQDLRANTWSLFANDDWRLNDRLTVSAGVRYDYVAPPTVKDDRANLYDVATGSLVQVGSSGMPRGGFEPDRNNIAPRAGFAWILDEEGRRTIKAGYGIYFNQGSLATSEGLFFNPPYFNLSVFFPAQGLPPLTVFDPFPANFPVFIPQSATAYQRDLQTPWMEHYNITYQWQMSRARGWEFSYVGSRGHDLISARDVNQPQASPAVPNLRPNPLFADITLIESRATSRYNSMQVKYQHRFEDRIGLLASYTYGKSTDDASGFFTSAGDPNFPQNSLDPGAERSRSSFDVRHRFSAALTYLLPVGGNKWLDDWYLQGIVTFNSGRPFTVAVHPDIDASNTGRSNLGFGNNDRPNVTGNPSLPVDERDENQWFNTAAFSMPAFGTFGNAGRNIVEGPNYRNINAALLKNLPLANVRLQFRLEAFNLLNRLNLDLPDPFLGSPTFGRILSAGSPRRIQFGVKAIF